MQGRRLMDDLMRVGLFWPTSRTIFPTAYIAEQNPDALDLAAQLGLAREVEQAGFDFGLLADAYGVLSGASSRIGHHDPSMHAVVWAMALFGATSRLGLISTMHPTFIDIIDLAQFGAQLDYASKGRWGWNVTTGYREEEPDLFGGNGLASHDERYGIAEEAVAIVRQLWSPGYPYVKHEGAFCRFEGRLLGPGPQKADGPVIVNAGASDQGLRLAGRQCDYLFAPVVEHSDLRRLADRMSIEGQAAGRPRDTRVLANVQCLMRDDRYEAHDEWEVVSATMASSAEFKIFTERLSKGSKGAADAQARGGFSAEAKAGGLNPLVGTPDSVADELIDLYHDFGYRGVLISAPYWGPGEMARYARVFERLEQAGVWEPSVRRESLW